MTTQVAWATLTGDDVEAVVSMVLCLENPSARRRRPTQGDQGVDVLVPTGDGRFDVYQVKKFASNLTAAQRKQIKRSYGALRKLVDVGGLLVRNWYLTLPLDGTSTDDTWFDDLTENSPFDKCEWRGLTFIDGLTSKHPQVPDYYLYGGKARIDTLMRQLMTVLDTRDGAGKSADVGAATAGLQALHQALNTQDPFYRYDFSVGATSLDIDALRASRLTVPDNLVFATETGAAGLPSVQWRVYAKCAEAVEARPIPIELFFDASNPEVALALKEFQAYGKPFETPPGTVDVIADLPGGLGGTFTQGSVRIMPTAADARSTYVLRLRARDAAGYTGEEIRLIMQKPTVGFDRTGTRISGIHDGGAFTLEALIDLGGPMSISTRGLPLTGIPVARVLAGVGFLFELPGSTLQLAAEFGPWRDVGQAPGSRDEQASNVPLMRALSALARIQQFTAETVLTPEFRNVGPRDLREWEIVADLLEGNSVEDAAIGPLSADGPADLPAGHEPGAEVACAVVLELRATVGDQTLALGHQRISITSAVIGTDGGLTVTPTQGARWVRQRVDASASDLGGGNS